MNRRCFIQMSYYLLVCLFLMISTAAARVCFLPDSTDCGEGDVVGGGNVEVPCQHSTCPAYNSNYQECYDERTYNNGGVNVTCKQIRCKLSKSECEEQEANANNSQCCNFDSASGCYYMGGCKSLCNRDVYDSEKDLGEDYNCTSCKDKNGTFYNCTPINKECSDINSNYSTSCGDSQIAKEAYKNGVLAKDSHGNQCYTCEDQPAKTCADINKDYKNKDHTYQCDNGALKVLGVSGSDGQCYQCIKMIDRCLDVNSKIYYVSYIDYLQGDIAIHSGCHCFAYLVKGYSQNSDPVQTTAISTPGSGSSSAEKIQLPTILTNVSSSNPYSVKIEENSCYGDEHCSAQAVKFDVFEAYAPETAKRLKEDDDFTLTGGITFSEAGYYYTGRQLKPKSQNINTCGDYVVILGNGNPKACAQISSDYYNYHEACPKGYEKKKVSNVYDSTGAQCYTCEKATPVITITYKETYNSLTPDMAADADDYYYKTLKFTSTSSDNVSRTIQMKTYPGKTCKTQYTTGSPVTINEGTETVYASLCGTKSETLLVPNIASLDTFIDGAKVYSFQLDYSGIKGGEFDGLDGKTVETNDYTIKFVKEKASMVGWGLHYAQNVFQTEARSYKCESISYTYSTPSTIVFPSWSAFAADKDSTSYAYAKDLNAVLTQKNYFIEQHSDNVRYPAGEYRICLAYTSDQYIQPSRLALTSSNNKKCVYNYTDAGTWQVENNDFCIGLPYVANNKACITGTFEDGLGYYVNADIATPNRKFNCCCLKDASCTLDD